MSSPLKISTPGGATTATEIESLKQQIADLTVLLNQTSPFNKLGLRSRQNDLAALQQRLNLLLSSTGATPPPGGTPTSEAAASIPRLSLGAVAPDPVFGGLGDFQRTEVSDLKSLYIGR